MSTCLLKLTLLQSLMSKVSKKKCCNDQNLTMSNLLQSVFDGPVRFLLHGEVKAGSDSVCWSRTLQWGGCLSAKVPESRPLQELGHPAACFTHFITETNMDLLEQRRASAYGPLGTLPKAAVHKDRSGWGGCRAESLWGFQYLVMHLALFLQSVTHIHIVHTLQSQLFVLLQLVHLESLPPDIIFLDCILPSRSLQLHHNSKVNSNVPPGGCKSLISIDL